MMIHHRILPIPCKPYSLNWLPERLIVIHYENNYGAAVQSLNAVRDRLAGMDPDTSIAAEIRALKREELSAMASVLLHELYFTNLSGDRKVPGEMMVAALEEHFGSVHRWRREFVGAAQKARSSSLREAGAVRIVPSGASLGPGSGLERQGALGSAPSGPPSPYDL